MNVFKSPVYVVGTLLLLGATVSSAMLSGTKLGFFETIPGCGDGSGCDAVTSGPWGTIPGTNLPVSIVGMSWFITLLIVFHYYVARGRLSRWLIWFVRGGAVASLGFIVVMLLVGSFCKWCVLAHVCNLLFWVICEFFVSGRENSVAKRGGDFTLGWWISDKRVVWVFLAVLGFFWEGVHVAEYVKLESDTKKVEENVKQIKSGAADESTIELLKGGHRIGSPDAPIQVVMFTDYQCPDCKRIEGQLAAIMKTRSDVSVVVKHFPLNFECNDQIGTFKLHGNACWAARAAEAASMVGGEGAWETMHTWLFSQEGRFTDKTFAGSLESLGFNAQEIISIMMGDETLEIVKNNARDGKLLGVYFTPMVFINGVEYLWYYGGEESLQNVINSVSENIKSGAAEMHIPPSASDKLVEDWRRGRTQNVPEGDRISWMGDGTIDFVVWGDYQAALSKDIDKEIKALVNKVGSNVRYTFRHFPVDESCNAGVSKMPTKYDGSCLLAKLVIACDALGGGSARWNMHNWILNQTSPVNLDAATEHAIEITGVDLGVLQDVLGGIDVNNQMRTDIFAKNRVWRKSVPVVMIDNRYVPRWRSEDVTAAELFQRVLSVIEDEGVASSPETSR